MIDKGIFGALLLFLNIYDFYSPFCYMLEGLSIFKILFKPIEGNSGFACPKEEESTVYLCMA